MMKRHFHMEANSSKLFYMLKRATAHVYGVPEICMALQDELAKWSVPVWATIPF